MSSFVTAYVCVAARKMYDTGTALVVKKDLPIVVSCILSETHS